MVPQLIGLERCLSRCVQLWLYLTLTTVEHGWLSSGINGLPFGDKTGTRIMGISLSCKVVSPLDRHQQNVLSSSAYDK